MDTKFSSDYWSHPQVEAAAPEIKLAGAWMRTNAQLTFFGYGNATPKRFAFETGLPEDTLGRAIEALPEWFVMAPTGLCEGYFIPRYIGEQIGRGERLLANNLCKPLARALAGLGKPWVLALVLEYYPELEDAIKVASYTKPFATPPGGVREREGEREGAGESESERERGAGENPRRAAKRTRAPGILPSDQPEPNRSRMVALNAIFRRSPVDPWSAGEQAALENSGLLTMHEPDFTDACETVRVFYHAGIPREMEAKYWKRTTLEKLLANWGGELDKARGWVRERDDGIRKIS